MLLGINKKQSNCKPGCRPAQERAGKSADLLTRHARESSSPSMANDIDLASIIDRIAPMERIITALGNALEAETWTREGNNVPDHRTRTAAAQALMAYRLGRPGEAPEPKAPAPTQTAANEDLRAVIRRSPSMRKMLGVVLDEGGD